MRSLILCLTLSAAVFSTGCASTSGYVVKANGVEISEKKSTPDLAIALGVVAAVAVLGISLSSGSGEGDAISREDQYRQCLEAGLPEPHCRSLVT